MNFTNAQAPSVAKTFKKEVIGVARFYHITYDDFCKLCIALGTDFCKKSKGVGPMSYAKRKIELDESQMAILDYIKIRDFEPQIIIEGLKIRIDE